MKVSVLLLALLIAAPCVVAQRLTQTVRGKVIDQETHFPLPGATVILVSDSSSVTVVTTNEDGDFRIDNVAVGRYQLKISFIGYKDSFLDNVLVISAKEVVLTISLAESTINLQEVIVTAGRNGDAANEMAMGSSSRSFTVEETQRYAGSRGDPARMASNFAGVQGADDSRNDIIIRGNSPQGVLWRMEGINIPNPNHFNIPGTAGGPVSMINNQTLSNSDFFSGAFPAEYGNSISGVFDLKLRNGNNEKYEHSAQFGFLGTEIFSEGPLSSSHASSYLVSYRYSTLAIFNKVGIDIGTTAVPRYQDIAFKLNFPQKGTGSVSLFGLGGKSNVDILISDQEKPDRNIYGENDRDQYFKSAAGVLGLSYKKPINTANYFQATLAVSSEVVDAYHELVYRRLTGDEYVLDSLQSLLNYHFRQAKVSGSLLYAKKIRNRGVLHSGLNADVYLFSFRDSVRNINKDDALYYQWRTRWDSREEAILLQPFVQWKYNLSPKLDLVAGLHSQYFSLSKSFIPAEPRAGLRWAVSETSTVNIGAGMHSQIQPTYLYFYGQSDDAEGNPVPHNKKMGFTRSVHFVTGYEHFPRPDFRLKGEIYYQYLYRVPVEQKASSFSLLNTGASFSRFFPDTLVNNGTGTNFGIELTAEKFFSKGYLFLITGSLFNSRYQGSDGIRRDTDFNGNYVFNVLFTKEWFLRNKNTLAAGGKVTTAGGRRYGPVDITASERDKEVVWVDATRNSLQFRPYFRADVRINYSINRPKVTHEIALDLVNVLGIKNILKLTYAPNDVDLTASPVREEYQLGFLPLFYYRISF